HGATEPGAGTPTGVARTQRQLRLIQWAIPALTGGLLAVSALEAERQRASSVARDVAARVTPSGAPGPARAPRRHRRGPAGPPGPPQPGQAAGPAGAAGPRRYRPVITPPDASTATGAPQESTTTTTGTTES
ncbi:MAG: hypothetical protein M3Q22_15385, partial [Actinomycetota bacterium]|nr:hypothetical protein [Actinomycetota bacterium]